MHQTFSRGQYLLDQHERVLTRTAVLRALWGNDSFFNGRSLDVFITRLRPDSQVQILNVRGVDYPRPA